MLKQSIELLSRSLKLLFSNLGALRGGRLAYLARYHLHRIRDFPKLERCDVLVDDRLRKWDQFIKHAGPKIYMRFVDAKTGEWFDAESERPYIDYINNSHRLEHGLDTSYTRIDDNWDEENEEDVKKRYEAMIKMKEEGLPRINLDN